jgi:hypothetical protein
MLLLRYVTLLAIVILVVFNQTVAQQGAWVQQPLTGPIGQSDWSRDVGSDCIIFVWKDSTYIHAYDNISGQWHKTNIPTSLPWKNTAAGDSVALVWSSDHIVGYSALNHTFVKHKYEGTLLGGLTIDYGYGAGNTLACVLTSDSCYVFDAEDSQWHIYGYNPPAYGDSMHISIRFEKDYLLVSLVNSYGWVENTLIAYSRYQKTFWELNGDYIVFQLLIGGFAFYRDYGEEVICYFGAWSAINNQETLVEHNKPFPAFISGRNRGTTFMFQTVDNSNPPEFVHYYYGYDTRHGTFEVLSVSNDYYGNHKVGLNWELWKNGAVYSFRYFESGQTEYYIYSGDTHSFTLVGPSDLGYDPAIGTNYGVILGNNVMMAWGCYRLMGYDLKSGSYEITSLPIPTQGYQNPVSLWSEENSAHAHCKRALTYKFHIYTYNRLHNTTITELVETVPDQLGYGFIARFEQDNVFGFLLKDSTQTYILLLYSPTADQWTRRILGYEPGWYGSHRDYIYWSDPADNITIFNGITNSETQIAFGYNNIWYYQNYINHRDNYFVAYTASNQYTAYSSHTNTVTNYVSDFLGYEHPRDNVVLSGNDKTFLAYSALYNGFVPLVLTEEDGIGLWPWGGNNTALVMASGGYLYAFNPYGSSTGIDDHHGSDETVPYEFSLSQNYPNPLNPVTTIKFDIPVNSIVRLKLYNILGEEVITLVNEERPAGTYEIEFDASSLTSGIYFYRLQAGSFVQTKKMILLR